MIPNPNPNQNIDSIVIEIKYSDTIHFINVILITLYICILLHVFLLSIGIIIIILYLCFTKQWLNEEWKHM